MGGSFIWPALIKITADQQLGSSYIATAVAVVKARAGTNREQQTLGGIWAIEGRLVAATNSSWAAVHLQVLACRAFPANSGSRGGGAEEGKGKRFCSTSAAPSVGCQNFAAASAPPQHDPLHAQPH